MNLETGDSVHMRSLLKLNASSRFTANRKSIKLGSHQFELDLAAVCEDSSDR